MLSKNMLLMNSNHIQKARYFTVYTNQHLKMNTIIDGREINFDGGINEYDDATKAYLQKRWTKKEEIWPKMYIQEPVPETEDSLDTQSLPYLKKNPSLDTLKQNCDRGVINSQYIISCNVEEHFKPYQDTVLDRVVLNGDVAPMEECKKDEELRSKSVDIYRRFFFGDDLSPLELIIEKHYLVRKQLKNAVFMKTYRPMYNCTWTRSEQKRGQSVVNYMDKDLNFYDEFRFHYEPTNASEYYKNQEKLMLINKENFLYKMRFKYDKYMYEIKGEERYNRIASTLVQRILEWVHSIEFNHVLKLPPDFHITHAILNVHIWLILNRLKNIGGQEIRYLVKIITESYSQITNFKVMKIHLKKKNDFIKDLNSFMKQNRNSFERHFELNPKTSVNPYHKIDALVWSAVFFEKVDRYADSVYIVAEYLMQHYDYINTLSYEDIVDGRIAWDAYRVPLDYKTKICKVNPPLSQEDFEAELNSPNENKKFFYTYEDDKEAEQFDMPIDLELNNKINYRVELMKRKLIEVSQKYHSIDTFDYFAEREVREEDRVADEKKYVWKSKDTIGDLVLMNDNRLQTLKQKIKDSRKDIV